MEKKTNVAFLLLVIVVLIVGMVLYLAKSGKLDSLIHKKETVELKEMTDTIAKEDLAHQVEIINLTYGDSSRPYGTASFFEKELYKKISDERLLNGFFEYEHIHGYAKIFNVRDESLYATYPNLLYVIPSSKVLELGTNLLNKDLSKVTTVAEGDNVWLPFVKVDDYYYVSSDGGEPTPTDRAYTYIYKYEEEGKKAYAYVSVAKGQIDYDNEGNEIYNIYKGINTEDKYKIYNDIDTYLNFKIDNTNYQEFTKYKYTFELVEGKYKFISIEILK